MNKWKWNQFGKLNSIDELNDYFDSREKNHTEYYHYTKLDVVNRILENNRIRFGCVERFNDKEEVKQIVDSKHKFALCFSTGVNENLPLWYLYSGISGKGARLRLKKSIFKRMIEKPSFYLCHFSGERKISEVLLKSSDYSFKVRDVLYCSIKDCKTSAKYNTMTNYNIPKCDLKAYIKSNNGFTKNIIWFYEKETRLLIELTSEGIRKLSGYKLKKGDYCCVEMDISCVNKDIIIDLAPEISPEDNIFDMYLNIKNHVIETSKLNYSQYINQIEMDLFKSNIGYIKQKCLSFACDEKTKKMLVDLFERIAIG